MAKKKIRNRVAVVMLQDDKILLVQHDKKNKQYWLLPGGGVDFGETLADAAKRELMEETGLSCEIGDLIFISESIPPDNHRHVINYFFEACMTGGDLIVGADKQLCDVRWHPIEDIPDLIIYPNVKKEILHWIQSRTLTPISVGNRWE